MRYCLHGEQEIKSSNTEKEYLEQRYVGTDGAMSPSRRRQDAKCTSSSGGRGGVVN